MADIQELKEKLQELTAEEIASLDLIKKQDQERGFQKREAMYDMVLKTKEEVTADPRKLLEIEDQETRAFVAKKVLGKQLDEINFEEKKEIDTIIAENVTKAVEQTKIDDKIGDVLSSLPQDMRDKFTLVFKEFTEGKNLNKDNIDRFIRASLSEITPKDQATPFAALGSGASAGPTSSKPTLSDSDRDYIRRLIS